MTTKSKISMLALVMAILSTSSVAAFAADTEGVAESRTMRGNHGPMMEEMDYETMAKMHLERTGETLTEEVFNKMVEARQLMQEGDREGAKAIMDELGITPKRGEGKGRRGGMMKQNFQELTDEQKEVLQQARKLLEDAGIDFPPRFSGECQI